MAFRPVFVSPFSDPFRKFGNLGFTLKFSPDTHLFANGEQGAWYDPSDMSTMFQDSEGTTPVTAVEQPVGLILDKRLGLGLGAEVIAAAADRDFSSDTGYWTKSAGVTISGGTANWSAQAAGQAIYNLSAVTSGKYYEVTFTITSISAGGIRFSGDAMAGTTRTAVGTYTERRRFVSATLSFEAVGASTTASIDNVSVRELPGNHASQATTAAKATLGARINAFVATESMTDAAWNVRNAVTLSISGSMTKITENTATDAHVMTQGSVLPPVSAVKSFSIDAMADTRSWLLVYSSSGANDAWFNLGNGTVGTVRAGSTASIAALGGGLYRCTFTTPATTDHTFAFGPTTGDGIVSYAGNGTGAILVNKAHTQVGAISKYQRVTTATDYDSVGFPHYLKYDRVDDFMSAAGGGGGTTGILLCTGIRATGPGTNRIIWSDRGANSGYQLAINANNRLELSGGTGSPIATPVQGTPTTATTGGTLAAATYFYVVTALNANGETLKSNELSITTSGTTSSNTISWGAVAGATGYRIYRGTAAGAQNVYYGVGTVTSFVDTGAAATSGTPPVVGTTAFVRFEGQTVEADKDYVVQAWHDNVNLYTRLGFGDPASIALGTIAAGTTGFTLKRSNDVTTNFYGERATDFVYLRNSSGTALQRNDLAKFVAEKLGITI